MIRDCYPFVSPFSKVWQPQIVTQHGQQPKALVTQPFWPNPMLFQSTLALAKVQLMRDDETLHVNLDLELTLEEQL